jgi:hypothetical protein
VKVVEFGRLSDGHRQALEGDEPDAFDTARIALQFRPNERHVGLGKSARLLPPGFISTPDGY